MSALTVLIIRHAEKPGGDFPGHGFTAEGGKDDDSLVIRGWQRSGAWAALFGSGLGGADYPVPAVIYAADPTRNASGDADVEVSQRPWETITPLCDRLRLNPIKSVAVGEEQKLADDVAALTGVVLVCWEHKRIGEALLPSLQRGQAIPGLPGKWNGSRFDVALRLDRAVPGAPWSFRQLSPRLLSGDTDAPVMRQKSC